MPIIDDDDFLQSEEEECPGPADLESVLLTEKLNNVIAPPALTLDASGSLSEALTQMRKAQRGCALITEDDKLVGIFTERDVLMRVAGRPIDIEQARIRDYMTAYPVTLPSDSSVAFALNRMLIEGFRHIPLVDHRGYPIGVVSMRQLIEYLGEFFNRDLLTLPPDPRATFRNREGA